MPLSSKKIIVPLVITLAVTGYYGTVIYLLSRYNVPAPVKTGVSIISILAAILMIAVFIERIKEIRDGEEDDLGNY